MTARRAPTTTPAAPRAAIYCRKSVARGLDEHVNSLTVQRAACEAYCLGQGWTVVPTHYDDGGFTGRNTDRPGYRAVMADAAAGKFDRLVVYKLDRLCRSQRDFLNTLAELERHEVAFVSATQAGFDTSTAIGRCMLAIVSAFAALESDVNSERTADAMAACRRVGRVIGRTPYGFMGVNKHLTPNPDEVPVVEAIYALYVSLRSAMAVSRELNGRGWRTRTGTPWTKALVLRILRTPACAGLVRFGDELHEAHPGIIDRATWDAAQALLDARPEQEHRQSRNPDYLLAGVARCGCGAALTPGSAVARGTVHRYYTCVRRAKRGKDGCPSKGWPAEALETFVVDRIRSITADGALAEDVASRLTARIAERRTAAMGRRRASNAAADRAEREVGRLVDTLADATAEARVEVERRLQAQAQARDDARADVQRIDAELATLEGLRVDVAWVAQTLADFDLVWDHLTPLNRQRLVRALVTEVRVDAAAGTITARLVDLGLEEERAAS